jgi:hypothetical protein
LHVPTVQCPMLKLQNCSMHYNIFSLQRTLYFFIPTQQWISGSGADPFAALVISTPVSNFILNSETTCSYLFILLKNSVGTHLELLKFSIILPVLVKVAGSCMQAKSVYVCMCRTCLHSIQKLKHFLCVQRFYFTRNFKIGSHWDTPEQCL